MRATASSCLDGPFRETKEQLGGLLPVECESIGRKLSIGREKAAALCDFALCRHRGGARYGNKPRVDSNHRFDLLVNAAIRSRMSNPRRVSIDLVALSPATERHPVGIYQQSLVAR